jgi:hypothetical protein
MNDEQIRIWKEAVTVYSKVASWLSSTETRREQENSDIGAGNLEEIRTTYFLNITLTLCIYQSQVSVLYTGTDVHNSTMQCTAILRSVFRNKDWAIAMNCVESRCAVVRWVGRKVSDEYHLQGLTVFLWNIYTYLPTRLQHGIIAQKTATWIFTTMETSHFKFTFLLLVCPNFYPLVLQNHRHRWRITKNRKM